MAFAHGDESCSIVACRLLGERLAHLGDIITAGMAREVVAIMAIIAALWSLILRASLGRRKRETEEAQHPGVYRPKIRIVHTHISHWPLPY